VVDATERPAAMAERKPAPAEWEATHLAGFPAFVWQALRRLRATSEAAAVKAADLGNLMRTMELEGATCRRPPSGFNARVEAVLGVRKAPSDNPTVACYYLDEALLTGAPPAGAAVPAPVAPVPLLPAAVAAPAGGAPAPQQRAVSPRRHPSPHGGRAGSPARVPAPGAAPVAAAAAAAAAANAAAAAAIDWVSEAGPSDPAQSIFLRTVLPGEPPFTQHDVDGGFLAAARLRMRRVIDGAEGKRWVPLHGRTIITTPVGGAAAPADGGGSDQQRMFEVCLSQALDGGTPRVGADGSLTSVYLGRWAPPAGIAARPPAVVTAAAGYVAVKVVTLPSARFGGGSAPDARLPFSEALAAQWASDAQGSSWNRLFLSLLDSFSEDGRGTTPPKVVMVMELALATLHERLHPPPGSGLEVAAAAHDHGPVPFPMSERESHYSAYAVVRSVRYLHRGLGRGGGLLHRDIAPRNVFYTWDGSLVLGE
jgi:hypothetical protein